MNPAQRLLLDVRIAEEGMTELDPHGQEPDDGLTSDIPDRVERVFIMDDAGIVGAWHWKDSVPWHHAAAYRMEDCYGNAVAPRSFDEDDQDDEGDTE